MTSSPRRLPIYDPSTSPPKATAASRKRTVHASGDGLEIVQYKRPTTWMLEATPSSHWQPGDGFEVDDEARILTSRRNAQITPEWAGGLVAQLNLTHYAKRSGGKAFDRAVIAHSRQPVSLEPADPWATVFCSDCGRSFTEPEWNTRVPDFGTGRWLHAICTTETKAKAAQEIADEQATKANQPTWLDQLVNDPVFG